MLIKIDNRIRLIVVSEQIYYLVKSDMPNITTTTTTTTMTQYIHYIIIFGLLCGNTMINKNSLIVAYSIGIMCGYVMRNKVIASIILSSAVLCFMFLDTCSNSHNNLIFPFDLIVVVLGSCWGCELRKDDDTQLIINTKRKLHNYRLKSLV